MAQRIPQLTEEVGIFGDDDEATLLCFSKNLGIRGKPRQADIGKLKHCGAACIKKSPLRAVVDTSIQ